MESAKVNYRYFGDSYNSIEHNFKADANFEVNIADELINTVIFADVLNGTFNRGYNSSQEINYTQMNFGITPSLVILRDDLTLNLGASFVYGLDAENSDNNFYIYPQVSASYRLAGEYFIPYAGLEGGLSKTPTLNLLRRILMFHLR